MTEYEFERARAHLWHSVLKNEVLLPLLPHDRDWSKFYHDAVKALKDNSTIDYPEINPNLDSVKMASICWLNGAKAGSAASQAVLDFIKMFHHVEYLHPISGRRPSETEVTAWVESCSDALRKAITIGLPIPGEIFWPKAIQISVFLQGLEHGTVTFWEHFEQVF